MKYIKYQENLEGKVVLLRLDLNVPLKNQVITDETRINKILPVINFLINKKSKILIISHIGRPKGKINNDLSLKPICKNLEKKIDQKIELVKENIYKINKDDLFKNSKNKIIFLIVFGPISKIKSSLETSLSSLIMALSSILFPTTTSSG